MFITDIMMSDAFWNTLSEQDQEVFKATALKVARLERQWSEDDHSAFEASASLHGKTITPISEEDRATMKAKALPVYEKWDNELTPNLIADIKKYN